MPRDVLVLVGQRESICVGKEWTKTLEGWTAEDFRRMYENVDAVTDIPAAYFWEEIHKAFPDAKVIVAGVSKTGTKSMVAALTKLGYKVYDFVENVFLLEKEWTKIMNGGWTTEDFRRMYEDVDAVTDAPPFFFWEEILKAFPEAKIILMMRENDDVWFQSFKKQMYSMYNNMWLRALLFLSPTYRRTTKNITAKLVTTFYGVNAVSDIPFKLDLRAELMKLKYRTHNAYVLQNAPAHQLLVYKPADGWEPLCKFLDKPIPDELFPHKNQRADIMSEFVETHPVFHKLKIELLMSVSLMVGAAGLGMYICQKSLKNLF